MSAVTSASRRLRLDWLLHETFEISILLKGGFAILEALAGVLLWLIGPNVILALVAHVHTGLAGDPTDWLAATVLRGAEGFSIEAQHFYAIYLVAHGLVKLALVIGLLKGARWAHPTALVVLAAFVAYQLLRFSHTLSPGLLVLTVFDLFVIALIWREWRIRRLRSALM